MTTPAERLAAAIHLESAAIAPQTSPLIEAAKEVLAENERLRDALRDIAAPGDEDRDPSAVAERAITQQLTHNSEEGK